jgi:hypothetical protein
VAYFIAPDDPRALFLFFGGATQVFLRVQENSAALFVCAFDQNPRSRKTKTIFVRVRGL